MGAVSKTYHFPKPRQEKERMPKAMFSPEGRLIEPYKGYRGNIKWRDANVHGDAVNYGAAKITQSHANAAQAETDKQKAYSDAIKNRFTIRDSLNKPPPPDRFINMAKNQQARSMGMGSAGMLDTPPGVKPLLSGQRPAELGNPDFVGPMPKGKGWEDKGSSPYQRIMENRGLGEQGARDYFNKTINTGQALPQSGSGVVYRPEKNIISRLDPTPKYAAEEGRSPGEMMQIRQAADLRTAGIDQAKEAQYEKWAREDSQDKLKADAEKYKIDAVTEQKNMTRFAKTQQNWEKNFAKAGEEFDKNSPPGKEIDQNARMAYQIQTAGAPPRMYGNNGGKDSPKGKKTDSSLNSLKVKKLDTLAASHKPVIPKKVDEGKGKGKSAPVDDKTLNGFRTAALENDYPDSWMRQPPPPPQRINPRRSHVSRWMENYENNLSPDSHLWNRFSGVPQEKQTPLDMENLNQLLYQGSLTNSQYQQILRGAGYHSG